MRALTRMMAWLALACASVGAVCAQADFTFRYTPVSLGSADKWGYAHWKTSLGQVTLNGRPVSLDLVFSSDPRLAAGALGKGWRVPFFDSSLVDEGQSTLRWHRPDGRIFYFSRQRGDTAGQTARRGAVLFQSQGQAWKAERSPKNRQTVLTHDKSGAELVYEDGLLVRFSFAKPAEGVERYAISYNRLRRPFRLSVVGVGKPLVEFVYGDGRLAREVRVEEAVISFSYADASLNQFPAGPYLSKISSADAPSASISGLLTLSITYQAESGDRNRVRFERLADAGGNTGLMWDAASGFLREDDGAIYKIENPSLVNGGRPAIDTEARAPALQADRSNATQLVGYNWRPDEAKVTRTDRDGKSEFRFYDRARGIATRINKEGVTTKTYYLLTPGPLMNKVRKVEEVRGAKIIVLQRNAYDNFGRITRRLIGTDDIEIREYRDEGDYVKMVKYVNGKLVRENLSMRGGMPVKTTIYGDIGVETYAFSYDGSIETVIYSLDGKYQSMKKYVGNKLVELMDLNGLHVIGDPSNPDRDPIFGKINNEKK